MADAPLTPTPREFVASPVWPPDLGPDGGYATTREAVHPAVYAYVRDAGAGLPAVPLTSPYETPADELAGLVAATAR